MRSNIPAVAVGSPSSVPSAAASRSPASQRPAARAYDGKQLVSQATISERQAITAAQGVASGGLNEVDLEHYDGKLVYSVDVDVDVDVGAGDVKVDATSGVVLHVAQDDR